MTSGRRPQTPSAGLAHPRTHGTGPQAAHDALRTPETASQPPPNPGRTPTVRRGLTVAYDKLHESVTLNLGESEIYRWPPPTDDRDKDLNAQWRLERFVAQRLGRLIDLAERFRDDGEAP